MAHILILSSFSPYPMASGDRKRLGGILRVLGKEHQVDFISPADLQSKASSDDPKLGERKYSTNLLCNWIAACDNSSPNWKLELRALSEQKLKENNYDALICFGHDVAAVLNQLPLPKIRLIDQCLLPNILSERTAKTCGLNFKARRYFQKEAKKQASQLQELGKEFRFVVCSQADESLLLQLGKLETSIVENFAEESFHLQITEESRKKAAQSGPIVLMGPFQSLVNRDALMWFSKKVMPHLKGKLGEHEVLCLGKGAHGKYLKAAEKAGLRMSGWVDDIGVELSKACAFAIPLRIGSGTKTRILDAGLLALPVVTTPIGAEGLPVKNGTHLLIEDDAKAYAKALLDLIGGKYPQIGFELEKLIRTRFMEEQAMQAYPLLMNHLLQQISV